MLGTSGLLVPSSVYMRLVSSIEFMFRRCFQFFQLRYHVSVHVILFPSVADGNACNIAGMMLVTQTQDFRTNPLRSIYAPSQ